MWPGTTVEILDVHVIGKTALALHCVIGGQHHWIGHSRLLAGSAVAEPGDVGVIVVERQFAVERRLVPDA
jgi:hypothetical protein